MRQITQLLARLDDKPAIDTKNDGASASAPFGQTGALTGLYGTYRLDADASIERPLPSCSFMPPRPRLVEAPVSLA
jgi:hypothetical protein